MDVVLETFDTFFFDRLYASILPNHLAVVASSSSIPQTPKFPNGTFSSVQQQPTGGYVFEPASSYFHFEPTDYTYMSQWSRDNVYRQAVSLFLITWLFGAVIYFVCGTLSWFLVFDKTAVNHPKYLKNQIRMEMKQALHAMPIMAILTTPFFLAEVRGYSKIYDRTEDGPGLWYDFLQFPIFIAFTDFFIYWIHRGLHHPRVYKTLHKPHHKWIVPTPFASHAFHPLDGFAQSIPYHVFPFVLPLQKFAYIALFTFINVWTVMIHDGEYHMNSQIINGAACHTMHHLYFNYNYGQFFTLWDRLGGSYRKPNEELFRREEKMSKAEWERQAKEMEHIVKEVEGKDDRVFAESSPESKKLR